MYVMKNTSIILILVSLLFLTSCRVNMGVVMPMGDGVYTLTGNWRSGYVPLGSIRKKVYKEADTYAKEKETTFEVIAVNEVKAGFAIWPQVDLTFRLVNESVKVADPNNTNSKTTIKAVSASGKTTTKQIISKKDNSKKDDEKYDRLLKLGKLKEAGLLTDEEFQKEKKKILNDE